MVAEPRTRSADAAIRAAFVMEQTLGHVTHARNLQAVLAQHRHVRPTWLPIPFEVGGPARLIPLFRGNWSVRASWRARRALDAALRLEPHDAIFFHTQVASLFSTSIMRRIPSIVSLDATPINYDTVGRYYNHRQAGDGFVDRQKYRLNQRALHTASALVSWSDWTRRSLVDDYGVDSSRIRVIAPGAAPEFFRIGEHRQPRFERDRRVRVLFVGGDFDRKGGRLLLECIRGPLGERCELHLVTGADVPAQPNVHVHRGLAPNSPELLQQFAGADLFVLPTLADCLAVVLMEATAAGLPVITTDVGALREAIVPGDSGLLVQAGDGHSLSTAIGRLVESPALRGRMGRAGRDLARRKFDAQVNNRALLDLVSEVALGDVQSAGKAA
jgi:glycosyltransferase involved in cell wall biosynthesis